MHRPKRDEAAGAIHHVVPQGIDRRRIVLDDIDRVAYLRRFNRVAREHGWLIHAGCLMDTHHHAVVETPEPNLGKGMGRVLGGHARWFNLRHAREGNLFTQHFWSRRITNDGWLLRACLYVVLNPVTAGLCAHPGDWRWSSYRATADGDPRAFAVGEERLLGMFGLTAAQARRTYKEVIDDAVEILSRREVAGGSDAWGALGGVPFVARVDLSD